jgi:ADP-heptose:LPS heptosyltransferase
MRVLYSTAGGIGNVVMATPAISALAEMGLEVTVLLPPELAGVSGLLSGWRAVKSCLVMEPGRGRPPSPRGFDLAVHSCWSRARGLHPEELSPGSPDLSCMHEAEANMIPVRELGYAGPTPPAHVEFDASGFALEAGTYWALAPGCKTDRFWFRKRWGGFDALAGLLPGLSVFLGTRDESREWMSRSPERVDLCGKTTLREAAGLIARSRGFIGIDCGLAHVAAAVGTPTVVLFGATSEVKNRPLGPRVKVLTRDLPCRPCQMTRAWDACTEWRCMGFGPEEVAGEALGMAGAGPDDVGEEGESGLDLGHNM